MVLSKKVIQFDLCLERLSLLFGEETIEIAKVIKRHLVAI